MDKYSGQAQIVYKEDGQEFLYWAHLNNPEEIAPFMTRAAETIALQNKEKMEEEQAEPQQQQNNNPLHNKKHSNHSKSNQNMINNINNNQQSDDSSPEQININGNNMNANPLANVNSNSNNQYNQQQNMQQNMQQHPRSPQQQQPQQHNNNNQYLNQQYGNGSQQNNMLQSFISPPATTIATQESMGYNSNQATVASQSVYPHQSHGSLQFSNSGGIQPPPANNMGNNGDGINPIQQMGGYNRNSNSGVGSGSNINSGSNMNLYSQMPNDNMNRMNNNGRIQNAGHSKSRSRVFPTTIKNKKLPPKPAKNMGKRKNKGINRSRTQPLPDNQNNPNNPAYNPNNNNMNNNNNNMMYNNNNNNKNIKNKNQPFNDLSFNAGQQFQSQKHKSSTNFVHGTTTYTAQVKPASTNNLNQQNASPYNQQYMLQQNNNNQYGSYSNQHLDQYGSVSSPANNKKLPPNPFPKKYSGDQHDNI